MRSSRSGDLASAALPRRCRLAGPRRCRRLFLVGARRGSARLERGELKEAHQRRRRGRAPPAPTRRRALATRPRPGPRCDDEAASRDLATARPRGLASATLRSSAWPRPCRLVCCWGGPQVEAASRLGRGKGKRADSGNVRYTRLSARRSWSHRV